MPRQMLSRDHQRAAPQRTYSESMSAVYVVPAFRPAAFAARRSPARQWHTHGGGSRVNGSTPERDPYSYSLCCIPHALVPALSSIQYM
jgi:hypothetical protein